MKKIIFIIALVTILLLPTKTEENKNYYSMSAIVTSIENNEILLEDTTGNLWAVSNENLKLYGRYIVIFDTMGTDDRIDDEIVGIE